MNSVSATGLIYEIIQCKNLNINNVDISINFVADSSTGIINTIRDCSNVVIMNWTINTSNIHGYNISVVTKEIISCSYIHINNVNVVVHDKIIDGSNNCLIQYITADELIVENCINRNDISGSYNSGLIGIIKDNKVFKMQNCKNIGDIYGESNAGMIVNIESESIQIKHCMNKGNLFGENNAGFVIEVQNEKNTLSGIIYNCINYSDISGELCGGFVVTLSAKIMFVNCVNLGDIDE